MARQSLKKNKDFERVYRRGKSQVCDEFVIYRLKNKLGLHRIGFTVTKKLGSAVKRNRIRRRLKEVFRKMQLPTDCGYDVVIVARGKARHADFAQMECKMRDCIHRW